MECVTAIDNIVAFVQGEVDETLRREIAAHIRNCPTCRREANEVRRTLEAMREAGEDFTPSSRVWMQLMARIKAVRDGLDDGVAGGAPDTVEPYDGDDASLPGRMSRGVSLTPGRKAMAIAICAAVIVLLVGGVLLWRTSHRFAIEYKAGAVVYGSDETPMGAGEKFFVADKIRVGGDDGQEAQLVYPDGTKLYLTAPAEAQFVAEDTVLLVKGTMRVVKNGGERRFTVRTDYGSVDTEKAAFEITVDRAGRRTRLKVAAGQANFTSAGSTKLVVAGKQYEAHDGMTPRAVETTVVVAPAVDLDSEHSYAVGLAVFDPSKNEFVDMRQGRTVMLNPGEKARLRFRVTNAEDFAILFPRGNARIEGDDVALIRSEDDSNVRLWVRQYFVEAGESPEPGAETKIKLGNNESYVFYCEVPIEALGLKPGGIAEIYGQYGLPLHLYEHKTNGIKIGLAAPLPGGEDEPDE